ncbi:hypothetical protein K492DRAFT_123012 [Lichtheimia hyalospora FSU 10163]|nr:hypothetical protein K492DRAFT_123012 [Lichtheimia hyalospora FSU 10163]
MAPFSQVYQYALTDATSGSVVELESEKRSLSQGASSTGNEFFGRAPTVYSVPELPQAFHPIYPSLFTNMNQSNEVATILLDLEQAELDTILADPHAKHKDAHVHKMTFITNSEIHTFTNAKLDNSGQSTKDFNRQSFEIKLSKPQLLFGRRDFKLRAEQTDSSFMQLVLDMLAATGAAALSASWVRVFVNGEPLGLFVLTDDASTHMVDNLLHGGDWSYPYSAWLYKGNSIDDKHTANLAYLGDELSKYPNDIYKLKDKGEAKHKLSKENASLPLVEFIRNLNAIDPSKITDEESSKELSKLIDPKHTMYHLALSFLTGSWDGLWYQASNYYLTQDLQNGQWAVITYDFDESLGNGVEQKNLGTVPYDEYGPRGDGSKRVLVDLILDSPYYRAEFERILTTIVKRYFKSSVVVPRLKVWMQMLAKDIAWDRSLDPQSPGNKVEWTANDVESGALGTGNGAKGESDLSVSIAEWVEARSKSLCKQLGITDTDDLPPLGPYLGGRQMDGAGHVTDRASIIPAADHESGSSLSSIKNDGTGNNENNDDDANVRALSAEQGTSNGVVSFPITLSSYLPCVLFTFIVYYLH